MWQLLLKFHVDCDALGLFATKSAEISARKPSEQAIISGVPEPEIWATSIATDDVMNRNDEVMWSNVTTDKQTILL